MEKTTIDIKSSRSERTTLCLDMGLPLRLLTLFVRRLTWPVSVGIAAVARRDAHFRNMCLKAAQVDDRVRFRHKDDVHHGAALISEFLLYAIVTVFMAVESLRNRQQREEMKYRIQRLEELIYKGSNDSRDSLFKR
ncbi:unnamed protein product [Pichia kudriavzevii]